MEAFMGFVDRVTNITPWAGSLVPTTLTVVNLQKNMGLELVPALLIGAVVEAVGFVAITTAVDLYELAKAEQVLKPANGWSVKEELDQTFWVSVGAAGAYLVAVLLVNAILDPGDIAHKITLGLLSIFGVLGGLLVGLRNHLGKRAEHLHKAGERQMIAEDEAKRQARADHERLFNLQVEREREERESARRLQEEKLRLEHEEKLAKIEAESRRKLAKVEAEGRRVVSAEPESIPETSGEPKTVSTTPRKWADVPRSDWEFISEAPVSEIVKKYQLSGKDPERTARQWKAYAKERLVSNGPQSD
jgi:hypothetical protein